MAGPCSIFGRLTCASRGDQGPRRRSNRQSRGSRGMSFPWTEREPNIIRERAVKQRQPRGGQTLCRRLTVGAHLEVGRQLFQRFRLDTPHASEVVAGPVRALGFPVVKDAIRQGRSNPGEREKLV